MNEISWIDSKHIFVSQFYFLHVISTLSPSEKEAEKSNRGREGRKRSPASAPSEISTGVNPMEEELCLVNSCTTNTVLTFYRFVERWPCADVAVGV
jgi:hypothetical protein